MNSIPLGSWSIQDFGWLWVSGLLAGLPPDLSLASHLLYQSGETLPPSQGKTETFG